ncbi:MAG: DUF362 domain-containing protein [Candidatus Omnitrophica bacterium]|nr:DUF362 domain-containing protein [Candidatus Omnitrophota bacterium]
MESGKIFFTMSRVYFANAHVKKLVAEDTLPSKFSRLLKHLIPKGVFKKQVVAVKMHLGGNMGYTTIHPFFVKILIDRLKETESVPFITGGAEWMMDAKFRGYTEEVLGCPIFPASGISSKHICKRGVNFRTLKEIEVCGNIADADAMVVFSHAKGHGNSGFGGAIKNIAMGCVTPKTRGEIHRLMDTPLLWNREKCKHCYLCKKNCPGGAISFDKKGEFSIFFHNCRYCMHCVESCPVQAITIGPSSYRFFQEGMALAVKEVLSFYKTKAVIFINVIMNVTPFCDCWGFSTPSLVPDVGIMASKDIVALEQATIDAIDWRNYIKGSLPEQMKMGKGSHLFEKIHGKDPYIQVNAAEKAGLGKSKYTILEIK